MAKLIFREPDTIRSIFAHAVAAGKHLVPYMSVESCPKCDFKRGPEFFMRDAEDMELNPQVKEEAAIFLVHDQGVYIMSAAPERQLIQAGDHCVCVWAAGCNPEKDDDWWDNAHRLVGGDDFGEALGFPKDWATAKFSRLIVHMTAKTMRMSLT